jgi:RNA polymerase sigma factor, sigma-70 family
MTNEKQVKITATVTSYAKGLRGFIRKHVHNDADAEDILQDVWYQLSAVINTRPVEQVGAWLYRVAKNRIIDKKRKKSESTWNSAAGVDREEAQFGRFTPIADDDPETAYQGRMAWQRLWQALEELPPAQKQVFIWHELEQLSFAEIAEITGEPTGKLILRKHYAVMHLRKRLKIFYDELRVK